MATNTASYSFLLPTVGGDTNLWGGYLNSNWSDMDDLLDGTTPVVGIDINGGSIDGTPVGATTASTGAFTTLAASGAATLGSATITGAVTITDTGKFLLNSATGKLSFGKSTAGVTVDASAATDALALPVGTTAQRPTPTEGMIRRNSESGTFEGYDGSGWGSLGGAGLFKGENGVSGDPAAGAGDIFRVHEQVLNTNTTIDADENAVAAGPLAIALGVTLTVASGGNLVIV